ncbi:hypothetical protein QBC45DRAFT_394489 [Copromyces sp. CBS 386.78]|nr:hypothetical protein QBC45DRAFT_394489 [Copromyces sp. CBS 386.78]
MDEDRRPSIRHTTTTTKTSTTTPAQSTAVTAKQQHGAPYQLIATHNKSENDTFAFSHPHGEMEVIFEDDNVDEEDAHLEDEEEIVVVKFGPYHHSTNVTKFGRNVLTMFNELETVSEDDKPGTAK